MSSYSNKGGSMKNLNKARVNIMVSDMDQAISFYIDKLDLTLLNRYGNHYAEVDANGFMIGLHPNNQNTKTGNNISIGLGVYNFNQTIADLEAKGIVFKLENDGYIRLAHFSDPDGNLLFLAENT